MIDNAAQAIATERAACISWVGGIQVKSSGHQCANIDLRALPKQDAVGVDQVYLSIGVQISVNLASGGVANAVDGNGCRRRLYKVDAFLLGYVEALPIQRQRLTGLRHRGVNTDFNDAPRTSRYLSAHRGRLRKSDDQRQSRSDKLTARPLTPTPCRFCNGDPGIGDLVPNKAMNTVHSRFP